MLCQEVMEQVLSAKALGWAGEEAWAAEWEVGVVRAPAREEIVFVLPAAPRFLIRRGHLALR